MMMNEELLNEDRFLQLNQSQQLELIAKHCAGIEKRIHEAQSRKVSETIAEEACGKFETECPSDIIRRGLIQRVREMVEQRWGNAIGR
jgi:predicted oxidoreductase